MAQPFGSFEYTSGMRSAVKGAREAAERMAGANVKRSKFLSVPAVNEKFFESMRVVQFEDGKGGLYSTVTSNLEDKIAQNEVVPESDFVDPPKKVRFMSGRKAKYNLEAVLLDGDIQKKFGISKPMLGRARSLAVEDAVEAAKLLQRHIRTFEDYDQAQVLPGNYGYTWKTARESLKYYASKFPMVSLNTDAVFCGDRIFIYSENADERWRVSGHERVAWLVRLVHRIVSATSPEEANFFLNKELALLDICIVVDRDALSPNFRHDAAAHDELIDGKHLTQISSLSANRRLKLETLCGKNLALVNAGSVPCATAIRVSNRHVVTCEHVLQESPELHVGRVRADDRYSLADDVLVVRMSGDYEPWHLREPVLDEPVLLCYKKFGVTQFAGPFLVREFSCSSIFYTKSDEIQPGMSGGALVALSDLALLGFHSGVSHQSAFGARFSVELSARMWSSDDTLSEVDTVYVNTYEPLAVMRARGLNSNCRLCAASLNPVVSNGVLVGNSLNVKLSLCVVPRAVSGEFKFVPGVSVSAVDSRVTGVSYIEVNGLDSVLPQAFRRPIYGEHVLLMGKGASGQPYVTNADIKISQTYDSEKFQIIGVDYLNSELLLGCAVLALNDGAVLGMVVSPAPSGDEASTVTTAECVFVSGEIDETLITPMNQLARMFPNLDVPSWFQSSCDEMAQMRSDTLEEIFEYSRELLAMSSVRKSLYSRRRISNKGALEDPKFWNDTVLSRAIRNIDVEGKLMGLMRVWRIDDDVESGYVKILLILVYFIDKYEQSRRIVEVVEHLALI